MATDITRALEKDEAQELTTRIKTNVESLWHLLTEAKERRAWEALGYVSWAEYVRVEFDMSKGYSYRILHQGKVIHELAGAAGESPMGDSLNISERQTRHIPPEILPQAVAEVREAVEAGTPPVEAIRETVSNFSEARRREAVERAAFEAYDDPSRPLGRVNESIEALVQKWELKAIAPAMIRIHNKHDVEIAIERLSKNIESLRELKEVMMGSLAREVLS